MTLTTLESKGHIMTKAREDYAYVASRIDPQDYQNVGDFCIWCHELDPGDGYHYDSVNDRLVNRGTLRTVRAGTTRHTQCMKAINRLLEEEEREERKLATTS